MEEVFICPRITLGEQMSGRGFPKAICSFGCLSFRSPTQDTTKRPDFQKRGRGGSARSENQASPGCLKLGHPNQSQPLSVQADAEIPMWNPLSEQHCMAAIARAPAQLPSSDPPLDSCSHGEGWKQESGMTKYKRKETTDYEGRRRDPFYILLGLPK